MTVNGPEDVAQQWDAINWPTHEDNVRRLRRRIFKAAKDGDLAKVRSLQRMMLRSWSNTLCSVRQITQRNAGRVTAGIDGEVALTPSARMELAVRVHRSIGSWRPVPVRRVYIAKAQGKQRRPLGIPVIMDRCHQHRVKTALEPEWEARFEARNYGFRPGRSCQDAIEAIYDTCKGRGATRVWTLDADLASAFDKLDHAHLMSMLGSFPARGMVLAWLRAGVFEPGKGFAPTEEGSPQGGVISPLLLNVALHGMESAVGVRHGPDGMRTARGSPVLVRYCDDFVVCCHTRQQAEDVQFRLAAWLAPRGLAFNLDKTRIVSLEAGYDFLGFNIRRYRNGKLLIKPSKAAVKRIKHKLAERMRRLRGQNVAAVLAEICPITRGWASFYRSVVSKKTFNSVDDYLWKLTYKWARRSHPGKPAYWVTNRYYGQFNPSRNHHWVFGDTASGAYLPRMVWTPIVRHRKVAGAASPDDPALTDYWTQRRGRNQPPLDRSTLRLLKTQHGRCALCADLLLHTDREPHTPEEWRQWHRTTRAAITRQIIVARGRDGTPDDTPIRLVHTSCHRRASGTNADNRYPSTSEPLSGLA
jgi:RNA-directed DNA polymerase